MGKILVADDSSTIQKVVRITLANEAHQLIECMSEEELESALQAHSFDLVLLDYNLSSSRSGTQLVEWVHTLCSAPVMAMLGTFDTVDQMEIIRAGYKDSIVKPFESEVFISKCRHLIEEGAVAPAHASSIPEVIESDSLVEEEEDSLENWTVKNEAQLPPKMEEAKPVIPTKKSTPSHLNQELEDWGIEIPAVIGASTGEALLPPIIGDRDDLETFSMASTDSLTFDAEAQSGDHLDLDSTSSFDIHEFEAKFDQALPLDDDLAYPDNSNVEEMEIDFSSNDIDEEDPFAGMHVEMVSLDDLDPEDEAAAENISFEQTDPHNQIEESIELEKELESEAADDLWAVDETISSDLPKEESYGGIETNAEFVENIQFQAQDDHLQSLKLETTAPSLPQISLDELAEKIRESLAPMIETVIRQECMRIADQIAEKVAWEVIPDLAENIIRKEIKALTDSVE